MNCKNCGSFLSENDQFCRNCGATVNAQNNEMNGENNFTTPPLGNNNFNNNMNNQSNYNTQPNYNNTPNNKSKGGIYILLGVLIVAIIGAAVIFAMLFFNKDNKSDNSSKTENNNSDVASNTSSYKVNFKGFTLSIPDDLIYEEDDGDLLIGDAAGTWAVILGLEQGNFSTLKANKSKLPAEFQKAGYTSSMATEKTLKGVNFITLELASGGEKFIVAYTKANSMYFFTVTAYNQNNEYDYSMLEKIAPVLSTAKYNSSTNNIKMTPAIDIPEIADLAK